MRKLLEVQLLNLHFLESIMELTKEPYYKLTKIEDLSRATVMSPIQLVGKIESISDSEDQISVIDGTGTYLISNIPDKTEIKDKSVYRIYGRWDGVDIAVEKIIPWDIPFEKINLVFLTAETNL